jgi:hypothetical protein
MPVNCGRVVGQAVVNGDPNGVTPVAYNSRSWNLSINGKSGSWSSLEVPVDGGESEVVLANRAPRGVNLSVSVDVISIAPLVSATWSVALVIRDGVVGFGFVWLGFASWDDGPCLCDLRDRGRILTGSDGADKTAVYAVGLGVTRTPAWVSLAAARPATAGPATCCGRRA